jgi:hypothetical protein
MAAANTDKFKKAKRRFSTTVDVSGFAQGATTLNLTTTTGLDLDTAITLVVDPGLATEEVITGVVSGSDVINCVRGKEGTTDQAHVAGATVAMYFTETHWDDLIDGVLASHNQDGTIKSSSITASALATDAVETIKIKDANVTAAKLATDSVETAKIKDANVTTAKVANGAITSAKLAPTISVNENNNIPSTTSTSYTDLTGSSFSYTVPANGTKLLILSFATFRFSGAPSISTYMNVVLDGTQLAEGRADIGVNAGSTSHMLMTTTTKAAGTYTIKNQWKTNAGTIESFQNRTLVIALNG